jgi:phage tail-like protein
MKRREIERLLPEVFQRTLHPGEPLAVIVELMEALHRPDEDVLATIDSCFNAYRAPDRFVPFLAKWVDLDRFFPPRPPGTAPEDWPAPPFPTGLGRLRELIVAATFLSQWRGTARGLRSFLETATGLHGFEIDQEVLGTDGLPRPFHVRVRAPEEAARQLALVERIIAQGKPAYVTHELQFGPLGRREDK